MWLSKIKIPASLLIAALCFSIWLVDVVVRDTNVLVSAQHYQQRSRHQQYQQQHQRHNSHSRQQQQQQQQQSRSSRQQTQQQAKPASNKPKTHYDVLGVSQKATEGEIKKAYRQLAKVYHPDKNRDGNAEEAEKKFIELTKAYEILSDPQQKAIYDDELRYGTTGGGGYGSPFGGGHNPFFQQDMNQRFGGGNRRGQNPHFYTMEDVFREFHGQQQQHHQHHEEDEGEEEIYMFQGPDGRIYYESRRKPRNSRGFHFQFGGGGGGGPTSMLWQVLGVVILPLIQLFVFFTICSSIFKSCCGSGGNADEEDLPRRPQAARNNSVNATASASTSVVSNQLSIIEIQDFEKKGIIVLVAMNEYSERILLENRRKFRNDPLLFKTAKGLDQNKTLTKALHKLVDDYRREDGRDNENKVDQKDGDKDRKIVCVIALSKAGSRFDVIDVMCGKSGTTNAGSGAETRYTDKEVCVLVERWLEKMIEGRTPWQAVQYAFE